MIVCEHVALSYQQDIPVLREVSMHIEPGSFHFLTGPSGAGKTSLLNILSLRLRPSQGRLIMFGRDVTKLTREQLPKLRRKIGVVSQDYRLLPHLTVAQNVGLPLKVAGESNQAIREKVSELLEWVGLKDFRHAMPPTLSGGQQQRVAIARAVITKPEMLLADEPTGHLDPELSTRFMYLFEALHNTGTSILFATHDMGLLQKFNHPVLHLHDGRLNA